MTPRSFGSKATRGEPACLGLKRRDSGSGRRPCPSTSTATRIRGNSSFPRSRGLISKLCRVLVLAGDAKKTSFRKPGWPESALQVPGLETTEFRENCLLRPESAVTRIIKCKL